MNASLFILLHAILIFNPATYTKQHERCLSYLAESDYDVSSALTRQHGPFLVFLDKCDYHISPN